MFSEWSPVCDTGGELDRNGLSQTRSDSNHCARDVAQTPPCISEDLPCDNVAAIMNAKTNTVRRRGFAFLVLCLLSALATASLAAELTVAAAADLNAPLNEIAENFHQQTGDTARLSFG